jgi:hypothetical protein
VILPPLSPPASIDVHAALDCINYADKMADVTQ